VICFPPVCLGVFRAFPSKNPLFLLFSHCELQNWFFLYLNASPLKVMPPPFSSVLLSPPERVWCSFLPTPPQFFRYCCVVPVESSLPKPPLVPPIVRKIPIPYVAVLTFTCYGRADFLDTTASPMYAALLLKSTPTNDPPFFELPLLT